MQKKKKSIDGKNDLNYIKKITVRVDGVNIVGPFMQTCDPSCSKKQTSQKKNSPMTMMEQ
ncbi:hypothetical protein OK016_01055 [Vibrio chagasii]|nr:hypothetical protein [Vibrio chagasii]